MKKLFVLILTVIFTLPTFAVEMVVPRFQKDVNDACKQYFNTDTPVVTAMQCMRKAYRNDSFYTKGWTQPIKADVMYFIYDVDLLQTLEKHREDCENSISWRYVITDPLAQAYAKMVDTCKYSKTPYKKFTPEVLNELLYGK